MFHLTRAVVRAWRAAGLAGLAVLVGATAAAAPHHVLRLTFDADMTPGMLTRLHDHRVAAWYDPAILEYLHENHVPAAIFVSGLFAEAYPDLVGRLAHDPLFVVGVHGYRHAAYTTSCYGLPVLHTDAEKHDDLVRALKAIERATGRAPLLFRYPGLCHDAHDDALVRQVGLSVDTPTVVSGDPFTHDVDAVVRQVLRRAKDGGTVVFHLGGPNAPVTLEVLRTLVPELRRRGYEFGEK